MNKEEIIKNVNKVLTKIAKSIKEYSVEAYLERCGKEPNEYWNIVMKSKVNNGYEIEGCVADYYGHKEWELNKIIESKEEQEKWKNEWITNLREHEIYTKRNAITNRIEAALEEMEKILRNKLKQEKYWLLSWDIETLIYRINRFKNHILGYYGLKEEKIEFNKIEIFYYVRIKKNK